jgi:hypothetical protein
MNIETSCDQILYSVRSSQLNYSCQETPFSIYLTIRKTHHPKAHLEHVKKVDLNAVTNNLVKAVEHEIASLKSEIEDLKAQLEVTEATAEHRKFELEKCAAKETKHKKEVLHWLGSLNKKGSKNSD